MITKDSMNAIINHQLTFIHKGLQCDHEYLSVSKT